MGRETNNETIIEFLRQSNFIESEYSVEALEDAIIAWEYFYNKSDFALETLLHCHYLLMKNIDTEIAGKIRQQDVWIGYSHKKFISTQIIQDDLNNLFNNIVNDLINPKEAHIQYEYIHPFLDGNGRTGRIIWQAHRLKLGLPIEIIYEKNKYRYYKWFNDK